MFSNDRSPKKKSKSISKAHKDYDFSALYEIRSAESILNPPCYQKKIVQLKSWALLDGSELFEAFFQPVLHQYAEWVQLLPDARENNRPLLHVALSRCMAAMQKTSGANMSPRMQYAIFTASLLLQLGMIHTDYRVMLSDAEGAFLSEWSPFYQPMSEYDAPCYKVRPTTGHPPILLPTITPILAQKILPACGFAWLAEDPVLLLQWLNALSRRDDTGLLGQVLDSAEDLKSDWMADLDALPYEGQSADATQLGEAYWQWLQAQVQEGQCVINGDDSGVVMTEQGLLIDHDRLMQQFLKQHQGAATMAMLQQQFEMLGLSPLSGDVFGFQQGGKAANGLRNKTTSMFGGAQHHARPVAAAVARSLSGQLMLHKGLLTQGGHIAGTAKAVKATKNISPSDQLAQRTAIRFSGKRQISPVVQGK